MSAERALLESLRPKSKPLVMDLVTDAGFDTTEWRASSAGAANGKYCYNWSFVDRERLVVLCLWHEELVWESGSLVQRLNYKRYSKTGTNGVRNTRANAMDRAFQITLNRCLPVRVIIVDGVRRDESDEKSSKVARRMLDPESWAVVSYDENTGECLLIRGQKPVVYVDQHGLAQEKPPERRSIERQEFKRSASVRMAVLRRSGGECEFCAEPGFKMVDGRVFLETHHITPLAEGGPDNAENLITLCANHHREAHHGMRRDELRHQFSSIANFRQSSPKSA